MATTGEKVGSGQDGGNPNPAAETPGVTGPDDSAKDPAALPIGLTPGSGQTATPPDPNRAPTPVTVTLKNTSAARVVVYAVNPIEDTDPAGKGQPLVAWKVGTDWLTRALLPASFVFLPVFPDPQALRESFEKQASLHLSQNVSRLHLVQDCLLFSGGGKCNGRRLGLPKAKLLVYLSLAVPSIYFLFVQISSVSFQPSQYRCVTKW